MCPASKITAFRLVKSTLPNGGGETSMTRWYNWLEENSQLQDILKCQNKKNYDFRLVSLPNLGAEGKKGRSGSWRGGFEESPLLLRSHTRCQCVWHPSSC